MISTMLLWAGGWTRNPPGVVSSQDYSVIQYYWYSVLIRNSTLSSKNALVRTSSYSNIILCCWTSRLRILHQTLQSPDAVYVLLQQALGLLSVPLQWEFLSLCFSAWDTDVPRRRTAGVEAGFKLLVSHTSPQILKGPAELMTQF